MRASATKSRSKRGRSELVAFWNTLTFSSGPQTPDEFVRRIDWNSLLLTDFQKDTARKRVHDSVEYLLNPTFDAYYRLKTENLHYSFSLDKRAAAILGWTNANLGKPTPELASRALWHAVIEDKNANQPPKLMAVSLDRIAAITTTNGSVSSMLGGKLWKAITVAYAAPDAGINYQGLAAGERRETPLFLNVSLYARANTSTNSGPVHLSFFWSDPDQTWALNQMLTDVQLKLDTPF